jgi:surface antigen
MSDLGDLGTLRVGFNVDLAQLGRGLAAASAETKAAGEQMQLFGNKIGSIKQPLADVDKQLELFSKNVGRRRGEMSRDVDQMVGDWRNFGNEIERWRINSTGHFSAFGAALGVMENKVSSSIRSMGSKWSSFTQGMGNQWSKFEGTLVGGAITKFLGVLGGLMGYASKAANQLFNSMANWNNNAPVIGGLVDGVGNLGKAMLGSGPGFAVVTIGLAAVVALLGPTLVLLGGVVTLLTAFAVGASAVALTAGLFLGAVFGLGAAIVALAVSANSWNVTTAQLSTAQQAVTTATRSHETALNSLEVATLRYNANPSAINLIHLEQAQQNVAATTKRMADAQANLNQLNQQASNPLDKLKSDLSSVTQAWGQAAVPMATTILLWADQGIPAVQGLGSAILTWFGPKLSTVLQIIAGYGRTLLDVFTKLGPPLDTVFQHMLSTVTRPEFKSLFTAFAIFGASTLVGLLTNLLRLSNWFLDVWPRIGPEVAQIFDGIGKAVQAVAGWLGVLVGWYILHWPQILNWTDQIWHVFLIVLSTIKLVVPWVWQIIGGFLAVQNVLPGLKILAIVLGVIVTASILAVVTVVGIMVLTFLGLAIVVGNVWAGIQAVWKNAPGWFGNIWSQIGSGIHSFIGIWSSGIHAALDNVRQTINNFILDIDSSPLGALGVHINTIPKFAKGGMVPGYGSGDSVAAMLTPGEGVLTASAVRGLGGAGAVSAINGMGAGGGVNPYPFGQCTYYVYSRFPGMPLDGNAKDWWSTLPLAHSSSPSAGEIVVYGWPPYGHVAVVEGGGVPFPVTEMNYLGAGIVDRRMSDMSGVLGFLRPGVPGAPGAGGLGSFLDPAGIIGSLASKVGYGGLQGWLQPLAHSLVAATAKGAIAKGFGKLNSGLSAGASIFSSAAKLIPGHGAYSYDHGGVLPPGLSMAYNGLGRGEAVVSPGLGAATPGTDRTDELLAQAVELLKQIAGRRPITALAAQQRVG